MSAIRHLEVIEEPAAFYVLAEVPSEVQTALNVVLSPHALRISGQGWERTIPFSQALDAESSRATATFSNGVLEVRCPKVKREGKGRVVLATQTPEAFIVTEDEKL